MRLLQRVRGLSGTHSTFARPSCARTNLSLPSSPPFFCRLTRYSPRSLQNACLAAPLRATTGRCQHAPPIRRPPRRLTALLPPAPNSQNGTDAIFRSFGLLVTRHLSLVTAFLIATPRN